MSSPGGPPGGPPYGPHSGQPPPPTYQPAPAPTGGGQQQQPVPWIPPNASNTPNAERYLLEADALRRRQLRSALLHGSSRTWREHRRIWPGVASGIIVVAVILATFAVIKALDQQEEAEEEGAIASITVATAARSVVAPGSPPYPISNGCHPPTYAVGALDTIVR